MVLEIMIRGFNWTVIKEKSDHFKNSLVNLWKDKLFFIFSNFYFLSHFFTLCQPVRKQVFVVSALYNSLCKDRAREVNKLEKRKWEHTKVNYTMDVKKYEGSVILPYIQINTLPRHSFLNPDRRHETPGSEENYYCSEEGRQHKVSVCIHSSCPSSLTGSMWIRPT